MRPRQALPFILLPFFLLPSLFGQSRLPTAAKPATAPRPAVALQAGGCDPGRFLTRAYQDLLGRPLDSAGANYWLGLMKNGMSRTQVASQLMHNSGYTNGRVQAFYQAYLHRPPNGGDLAYFSQMLQQGTSSELVESAILASQEYFSARGGGTNQGFVAALYQDVLGRSADAVTIANFSQQLGAGGSRASIAQQVVTSAEARARWMNAVYTRYLHHAPAGGGLLQGGQDQVIASIIGSDEYCRQ